MPPRASFYPNHFVKFCWDKNHNGLFIIKFNVALIRASENSNAPDAMRRFFVGKFLERLRRLSSSAHRLTI
jgi:hypothetical protein